MAEEGENRLPSLVDAARIWGKQLDDKQFIVFKVICCSFFLRLVVDGTEGNTDLSKLLNAGLHCDCIQERDDLINQLEHNGAMSQLLMFVTGPAGCGKSTCVELAQTYCHKFCQMAGLPFDDKTFYFTSTTGSSACLFGGNTIHGAAHLMKSHITDALCEEWKHVKILIIDEVSFLKDSDIEMLDIKLRRLTKKNKLYGGISIVFSGDFHQLPPIATTGVLYSGSDKTVMWENTINCPIFLEKSHRFKNDPEWGNIMGRMRMGNDTIEDRIEINKHYRDASNKSNISLDTTTACVRNTERNAVEFMTWKNYITHNHPSIDSDNLPPDNVLFIECLIETENGRASDVIHDIAHSRLGDDDIKEATTGYGGGSKISPVMRCYTGSHHMVNTNKYLVKKKIGNGTQCKCIRVKLKSGARPTWKNWDNRKVYTVSAADIEFVEFEYYPNTPKGASKTFKLKPEKLGATINFPLTSDKAGIRIKLGKVKVTQLPVNCNIATTGHKLQGMSKDTLIINSWGYGFENWVYVVLSRVRTRAGLILNAKLDLYRKCKVPEKLLKFEERMKEREDKYLKDYH